MIRLFDVPAEKFFPVYKNNKITMITMNNIYINLITIINNTLDEYNDFHLFLGSCLFIYAVRSMVSRPMYKLVVNEDEKENYTIHELPILFRLFPLCFLFVYDVAFFYQYNPTMTIVQYTLPLNIINLKSYIEQVYIQIVIKNQLEISKIMEIREMQSEGLDEMVEYMIEDLDEITRDRDSNICLLRKLESLLLVFIPSYTRKQF